MKLPCGYPRHNPVGITRDEWIRTNIAKHAGGCWINARPDDRLASTAICWESYCVNSKSELCVRVFGNSKNDIYNKLSTKLSINKNYLKRNLLKKNGRKT